MQVKSNIVPATKRLSSSQKGVDLDILKFSYKIPKAFTLSKYLAGKLYAVIMGNYDTYMLYNSEFIFDLISKRVDIEEIISIPQKYAVLDCIYDILYSHFEYFNQTDYEYLAKCIKVVNSYSAEYNMISARFNNLAGKDILAAIFSHDIIYRKMLFNEFFGLNNSDTELIEKYNSQFLSSKKSYDYLITDNLGRNYTLTTQKRLELNALLMAGINPTALLDSVWADNQFI